MWYLFMTLGPGFHYQRFTLNLNPNQFWGDVAQLVARLTRDRWIPVSREFEPHLT